jgi:hypothetical protein
MTTRRDIWTIVGNAIGGGLPAPRGVDVFESFLSIHCDDLADAEVWRLWLGDTEHRETWIESNHATAHEWLGERSGWRWYIRASVPGVATALLTPDAVPDYVDGHPVGGRR